MPKGLFQKKNTSKQSKKDITKLGYEIPLNIIPLFTSRHHWWPAGAPEVTPPSAASNLHTFRCEDVEGSIYLVYGHSIDSNWLHINADVQSLHGWLFYGSTGWIFHSLTYRIIYTYLHTASTPSLPCCWTSTEWGMHRKVFSIYRSFFKVIGLGQGTFLEGNSTDHRKIGERKPTRGPRKPSHFVEMFNPNKMADALEKWWP